MSSARLRTLLEAAWHSIPSEELSVLVGSMYERCVAVITANGEGTQNIRMKPTHKTCCMLIFYLRATLSLSMYSIV